MVKATVPVGISIEGLSSQHKQVIQRIGFEAWLASYEPKKTKPLSKSDMPSYNRCALRSRCLKANAHRQAAYVTGKGEYCSPLCSRKAQSLKARERAIYRQKTSLDPHKYCI